MHRRALLRWIASASAVVPFHRVRLRAQPLELTAEAVALLQDVAPTVLPSAIGATRVHAAVDGFAAWVHGYREGVALSHGYGHPRLRKSGPSPLPAYLLQLAALDRAARDKGGPFGSLPLETRRALLDDAFTRAGVRGLPPRPSGQHVVVDLMAFYFRSTEANDDCYRAMIQREVCRPIQITTSRPAPKA
ncbi:MAG TPA: hypothetical protein VH497_02370 [Vicinamibacterales bacterium]|jgi:hypothetical protein